MKSLPIRVRLTAWYFFVLAVTLSLFGFTAYFAMRNSIHRTVDEELTGRTEGVRRLIERTAPYGTDDLRRELREHSELARGALLQVSDQEGNWLYRSASISSYDIPPPQKASTVPSTFVFKDAPLRVLDTEIHVGDQSYLVQVAAPLEDFYGALRRFGTLLVVVHSHSFVMCSSGWLLDESTRPDSG